VGTMHASVLLVPHSHVSVSTCIHTHTHLQPFRIRTLACHAQAEYQEKGYDLGSVLLPGEWVNVDGHTRNVTMHECVYTYTQHVGSVHLPVGWLGGWVNE
jgi:hypothetical protein